MFKLFIITVLAHVVLAVPAEAIEGQWHLQRIPSYSFDLGNLTTSLGTALDRRGNAWEAHAKYYALGGQVGSEIYISGTWAPTAGKKVGSNSGPCSARIGGLSLAEPTFIGCACQIIRSSLTGLSSECILDFEEEETNGDWAAGFSVAFVCNAFSSCTGSNAYKVSARLSDCSNTSATPCTGFRVTD